MVGDGRLTALEERYASTAERVAALEARWQQLADQYAAWQHQERSDDELSLVEDREFPDGYAVLRAQYDVDLELFELVRSMRELEDEIAGLRSQPVDDVAVIPAPAPWPIPVPSPDRRRHDRKRGLRIAGIAAGVVALVVGGYVVTRGSGEQPTVEVGVPARQAAAITWKLSDAKIVKVAKKQGGGCRKSVDVAIGNGAAHAGQLAYVRVDGPNFRVPKELRTRLDNKGRGTVAYETKRCSGSPANEVFVWQVGDDLNVAAKRSR
jgi:hypothetical protein